jgi:putative tricarboxylic transport membrane protein
MKAAGVDIKRMKIVIQVVSSLHGRARRACRRRRFHVRRVLLTTAGRLRIVGVSAPQRMSGVLADVPTWKEQGADASSTAAAWSGRRACRRSR